MLLYFQSEDDNIWIDILLNHKTYMRNVEVSETGREIVIHDLDEGIHTIQFVAHELEKRKRSWLFSLLSAVAGSVLYYLLCCFMVEKISDFKDSVDFYPYLSIQGFFSENTSLEVYYRHMYQNHQAADLRLHSCRNFKKQTITAGIVLDEIVCRRDYQEWKLKLLILLFPSVFICLFGISYSAVVPNGWWALLFLLIGGIVGGLSFYKLRKGKKQYRDIMQLIRSSEKYQTKSEFEKVIGR